MAKGPSCVLVPTIGKEASKLYKDLEKKGIDRPTVNLIYSMYVAGIEASMEADKKADGSNKYEKNYQGQFSASDVLEKIKWKTWANDFGNMSSLKRDVGAIDDAGNIIQYEDAKEALEKVKNFNSEDSGVVATVVPRGDTFQIEVWKKNEYTYNYQESIDARLGAWDIYKRAFNAFGIDLDNIPKELKGMFNAYNVNIARSLRNLKMMDIKFTSARDNMALFYIALHSNHPHTKSMLNTALKKVADIDDINVLTPEEQIEAIKTLTDAIDGANHKSTTLNREQLLSLVHLYKAAQQMQGLDVDALVMDVDNVAKDLADNNPRKAVLDTLKDLDSKFHISRPALRKTGNDINTWSQVAVEAMYLLKRQIKEIEDREGITEKSVELSKIQNILLKELASKRYYKGLLDLLGEATHEIYSIDDLLSEIGTLTGSNIEIAFKSVEIQSKVQKIYDQYKLIIDALANDSTKVDENISEEDVQTVRNLAKELKKYLDEKQKVIDIAGFKKDAIKTILREELGDFSADGQVIDNAVDMACADSSKMNLFYAMGDCSNPVIAAMGTILHNTTIEKTDVMSTFATRIRQATFRLNKVGIKDTKFMYEDDGIHIISDIDWVSYHAARNLHKQSLINNGFKGIELKLALQQWEENNTEDREVDAKNQRTERVPNENYRKVFPQLNDAQMEYYNTMMQIKGELGTMLPARAQYQYLAPQLRRNTMDAISDSLKADGMSNKTKGLLKAAGNAIKDMWTVREDDDSYGSNGTINGEDIDIVEADYQNLKLKQIPVFFVNKVEDGELLKDFSTGITALAGTAINYQAIDNVANVIEFVGDFFKEVSSGTSPTMAEIVESKELSVYKDVFKAAKNTNNIALVEGFIDKFIYGNTKIDAGWKSKLADTLIGYTSYRGLATNLFGMITNAVQGDMQMFIEATSGEYYTLKDLAWAHAKLSGTEGIMGDMMELASNNVSHKSVLLKHFFDPLQDSFEKQSHQRYHSSFFRHIMQSEYNFAGYGAGEQWIHYINMYAVLHNIKVEHYGTKISLFDAFDAVDIGDGQKELKLKEGITCKGELITKEFLDTIRGRIQYVNESCHGNMTDEAKGLIHRHWAGRLAMNFRQWMVGHYSRRFRGRYHNRLLGQDREGYWTSVAKFLFNDETKHEWKEGDKLNALGMFMKDMVTFSLRMQSQWHSLDDMQKHNLKRAQGELTVFVALTCMSFALGEPDEHKKEYFRRFCMYEVRRLLTETGASMPSLTFLSNATTILQSPVAATNTLNSLFYLFYGLCNGDLFDEIKSGDHKGENRYWRNLKKYVLPWFKDLERLQTLGDDGNIFKVMEYRLNNH